MKKSLVLMAMAGVALASCVNAVADVAQNQEQNAAGLEGQNHLSECNAFHAGCDDAAVPVPPFSLPQ